MLYLGPSWVVSKQLPNSCKQETDDQNSSSVSVVEHSKGKRGLEEGEDLALRKVSKASVACEGGQWMEVPHDLSLAPTDQLTKANGSSEGQENVEVMKALHDLSSVPTDLPLPDKQQAEVDQSLIHLSAMKTSSPLEGYTMNETTGGVLDPSFVLEDQSSDQNQSQLIHQLGRDISIDCLLRCSRSDYGKIALLNRGFRELIRSGYLYRLRRQKGIVEHWVYYACNLLEWGAFDPFQRRWMELPRMTSNECFMCSDKESLAVGTDLLVFGKEIMSAIIYKYSLLTNKWSTGMKMNTPRCLFGSASQGEIGIVAGGCDPKGIISSSAELYNSETGRWEVIPSMNKARKMCSGVFMDDKFYALGGIGVGSLTQLTSGEEYDLKTRTWRFIPNMFPPQIVGNETIQISAAAKAPPLIAVVNNQLYSADYAHKVLKKYDKQNNLWLTLGSLPERAVSVNGWGLAFRACGNRLMVIGGPTTLGGGMIEVNSWVPIHGGPPEWELLGTKPSAGSFVYNCAVMGC